MIGDALEDLAGDVPNDSLGQESLINTMEKDFKLIYKPDYLKLLPEHPVLSETYLSTAIVRATNPLLQYLLDVIQQLELNDPLMTELDLCHCTVMNETHGMALAKSLATNSHLKSLKLTHCSIGTQMALLMAKSLEKNQTLEILHLDHNLIQGRGIAAIGSMLSKNNGLKVLKLNHQKFNAGTEAEERMAFGMSVNQKIVHLSLEIKNVTARQTMDKALARNKQLMKELREE